MMAAYRDLKSDATDADLHHLVRDSTARVGKSTSRVTSIQRRLSDYRSSFAIEEVTASYEDGTTATFVFKNLSTHSLLPAAHGVRHDGTYDSAREVIVYREILSKASLGTPACYAAIDDDEHQRYWLLLEKMPGEDLARTGAFSAWLQTARWLANAHEQLNAISRRREIARSLVRYDHSCFQRWIDGAAQSLQQPHIVDGGVVPRWEIDSLLQRSETAASLAASASTTVIHGEFYPSNILVGEIEKALRICPIDWETTGVGPALLDLAALVSGNWSDSERDALATSYFTAREASSRGELANEMTMLRCCRLLLAMKWIGLADRWAPPPEHRYDWLAEALALARTLSADPQRVPDSDLSIQSR